MSCHSQTRARTRTPHTTSCRDSFVFLPLSYFFSPVPRVIEVVGIPVNPRTTHVTLEPSFSADDAFIMVKVIGLGPYTMLRSTQAFLAYLYIKKKGKTDTTLLLIFITIFEKCIYTFYVFDVHSYEIKYSMFGKWCVNTYIHTYIKWQRLPPRSIRLGETACVLNDIVRYTFWK